MGVWGTGAMDGDGPLDMRGDVARAAVKILSGRLYEEDDGQVFAAAHIAMDLQESGDLGFDYYMFARADNDNLAHLIRNRVAGVKIAEEWGGPDAKATLERIEVRRALLIRLDSLKARHRATLDRALGIARDDAEVITKNEESKRPCPGCDIYDCDGGHP